MDSKEQSGKEIPVSRDTRPKAILYTRVSTTKQEGENQEEQLRRFIATRGWKLHDVVTDVYTGTDTDRAGLNGLRHRARCREYDVLVVWAWDRITREGIQTVFKLLDEFEANGVSIVSMQEEYLSTAGSFREILLPIIAWQAKLERARISERTKAALQRKKNLGQRLGRPPGKKDSAPRTRRFYKKRVPPAPTDPNPAAKMGRF